MKYVLPPLPYSFDALEPYIDARTMEIHHDRHHQGYIDKLNGALTNQPKLLQKTLPELLQSLQEVPADIRTVVANNAGGTANHNFFWDILSPKGGGQPVGKLSQQIIKDFGSFELFQNKFNSAALSVFGSGWAWLCIDAQGKLLIVSTANQDSPLSQFLTPVLGLDVWEHAYYLHYQNRRPDYITAWWHVVNWHQAEENFIQK